VIVNLKEKLMLSCAVDFGASGAPVLVHSGDGYQVISVMTAMTNLPFGRISHAVTLGPVLETLLGRLDQTTPVRRPNTNPRVPTIAEQLGREDNNAVTLIPAPRD
jgi:protease YdgD